MCGIFFSVGFEDLPSQVIDSVAHRGPDGRGWDEFISPAGSVIMAHRRLAIVDLSDNGHQPMSSEDGRYWITYNGEIYNHLEIKAELEKLGHRFRTKSDTEVLLTSYLHWGVECLHRLNGMFAFIIWDDKEKKAFAARDRFGVKPLYYYKQGNKIAFMSEIKQCLYLPGFIASINVEHFSFFFENRFQPIADTTLFKNVYHVEPGHYLLFKDSSLKTENWYVPHQKRDLNKPYQEEFIELFEDAVKKRLISDVSVGALLSGGLDSSSIVCMISKLLNSDSKYKNIKTFTSWNQDPDVDERIYSQAVIKKTGLDNIVAEITNDSLERDIENIVYHQEEPFFSTSIQSEWNIYKTISKNSSLKVVLDGQGSDELTCGYLFMIPEVIAQHIYRGKYLSAFKEYFLTLKNHANLLWKTLAIDILSKTNPKLLKFIQALRGKKLLSNARNTFASFFEYSVYMIRKSIEPQLKWQDRSSMAFSIESRQPFLDYRLVEFLLSLPQEKKYFNGMTKVILRESLKGYLPEIVRNRISKFGFPSPQKKLVDNLDKSYFRKNYEIGHEMIKKIYVENAIPKNIGNSEMDRFFIFTFGLWIKKFNIQL